MSWTGLVITPSNLRIVNQIFHFAEKIHWQNHKCLLNLVHYYTTKYFTKFSPNLSFALLAIWQHKSSFLITFCLLKAWGTRDSNLWWLIFSFFALTLLCMLMCCMKSMFFDEKVFPFQCRIVPWELYFGISTLL